MKTIQRWLEMVTQLALADTLYKLRADVSQLSQEAYSRVHSDELWYDLWTDKKAYNRDYKALNKGWSIDGILSLGDLLEKPVLPECLVMFGWFDLLDKTDLPTNTVHWPIVSGRVLTAIHGLGLKPRVQRIRVLDRSQFGNVYGEDVRKYENDSFADEVRYRDDWFYGIAFQEISVLADDSDLIASPPRVKWREDLETLPAFFIDPKSPRELLVTNEGRAALESAGVQGVKYTKPFQL
jgi:hypothetical protein